jgi:hypothetical protein
VWDLVSGEFQDLSIDSIFDLNGASSGLESMGAYFTNTLNSFVFPRTSQDFSINFSNCQRTPSVLQRISMRMSLFPFSLCHTFAVIDVCIYG